MSESQKRCPMDKSITLEQIIQHRGYYDINGDWNSILTFKQYPGQLFRGRVEVFIFDRNNNVYMNIGKGRYRIPGGSFERNRSYKYQVSAEAKEEARIILGKITDTGYSYFKFFKNIYPNCKIHWNGTYNRVYIADFESWYYGPIKKSVRDDYMCNYGRFVPFDYAVNYLTYHHQKSLQLI